MDGHTSPGRDHFAPTSAWMTLASSPSRRRGFTLIELLVVIAIIALLISILVPSLGLARAASQRVACLAHLRGAGQGMMIYAADWRDFLAGPNTSGYHQ